MLFAPRQGRILVVDDAPANIQAVTAILREHGYQISVATNGRQALSVLERVRPDLILLDVLMPEMDGFEACRRIKHNPAYQDIPIIFLTAKTDATDIVRGFELGAVDYVPKPFNAYELLARVNTHLTLDRLNRENEQLAAERVAGPDRRGAEDGGGHHRRASRRRVGVVCRHRRIHRAVGPSQSRPS